MITTSSTSTSIIAKFPFHDLVQLECLFPRSPHNIPGHTLVVHIKKEWVFWSSRLIVVLVLVAGGSGEKKMVKMYNPSHIRAMEHHMVSPPCVFFAGLPDVLVSGLNEMPEF